jgi:hypothetical protein
MAFLDQTQGHSHFPGGSSTHTYTQRNATQRNATHHNTSDQTKKCCSEIRTRYLFRIYRPKTRSAIWYNTTYSRTGQHTPSYIERFGSQRRTFSLAPASGVASHAADLQVYVSVNACCAEFVDPSTFRPGPAQVRLEGPSVKREVW